MTDRELLELAAKAGGYDTYEYVENDYRDGRKVTGHYDSLLEVCINPLTNDGDALRLAGALSIDLEWRSDGRLAAYKQANADGNCFYAIESSREDRQANTRRAIVRAAAEIGKGMK
jgi:hypothetical protein